ncbi:MAG: squalene--hopene cyclase, partial [Stellaceae bacterium]
MMFDCLGLGSDPDMATAKAALRKLLVREAETICQPCLSPVWDTGLAALALLETDDGTARAAARRGLEWLLPLQELRIVGDWAARRPGLRPGGWAFQYRNPHYPDLDDTAMVAVALDRCDAERYREPVARAAEWISGMRSKSGGWAAFDADNEYYYLNYIPFADHGALLDPPTADVSARCVGLMAQLGERGDKASLAVGVTYLRRVQEPGGSWFGRWGTNHIYGTWSALVALKAAGLGPDDPTIRRAVRWLTSKQRADGGWGEDGDSYFPGEPHGEGKAATASQTAWALLGLIAAGEGASEAVEHGVRFLLAEQRPHGLWDEPWYTAVGFPRVFYLRYHGYRAYFPLWALARYR